MRRRTLLKAAATGLTGLPRFSIAQPANTRVLRFVPQANLTLLDPIITTAAVTANHAWMVWDTLFGVNAAQQPKPQMAEGYTVSDDGRTYLVRLRDGLKWHDGSRYGRRIVRPAWRAGRHAIRSARRSPRSSIPGVQRRRSHDQSRTEAAVPIADRGNRQARRADRIHDAGTGREDRPVQDDHGDSRFRPIPVLTDQFVAGSSAAWAKFDGYVPRQEPAEWTSGGKVAHFERIEWKIMPDAATASAALQNGEVDWYEQVQADLVPLLKRSSDIAFAASNPQGYVADCGSIICTRRSTMLACAVPC